MNRSGRVALKQRESSAFILVVIVSVSIKHNLLPQIKVCHRCDDLAAATVLPNSLSEVIAVQVVVTVQLIQHIVAVF